MSKFKIVIKTEIISTYYVEGDGIEKAVHRALNEDIPPYDAVREKEVLSIELDKTK